MKITVRVRLPDDRDWVLLVLENGEKTVVRGSESFVKPPGWGLPGGRMNDKKDKNPHDTANRELWEETGLTADIDPEPVFKIPAGEDHEVWLFLARNPRGEITITDPYIITAKWTDWKWVQPDEFGRAYVEYEGKQWPVYKTHVPLIHGVKPEPRMEIQV